MDLEESENTTMKIECIEELNSQNYSDKNTADLTSAEYTPNGLEEFNEILNEINKGIPKECASLDEVEDVLQNINDDAINKNNESQENYLDVMLEIPKFDFEELIERHLVRNAYDDKDEYIDIHYWESLNKADVISISSEDSQTEINEHENDQTFDRDTGNFKINVHNKQVINLEPLDVDDGDDDINIVIDVEKYETKKYIIEYDQNDLRQIDVKFKDPEIVDDLDDDKSIRLNINMKEDAKMVDKCSKNYECLIDDNKTNSIDENKSIISNRLMETNISINNVVEKKDSTNKNDDSKYVKEKENEREFMKMNVKELNTNTNDIKFIYDLEDDGYNSSDFEFITEEEAKLDGLIVNFDSNTHKREVTSSNAKDQTNVDTSKVPIFATKRQKTAQVKATILQNDTNVRNNRSSVRNDTNIQRVRNTGTKKLLTLKSLQESGACNGTAKRNMCPRTDLVKEEPKRILRFNSFDTSTISNHSGSNIIDTGSANFEETNGERLVSFGACYSGINNFGSSRHYQENYGFKGFDYKPSNVEVNGTGIINLDPSHTKQEHCCELNSGPSNGGGSNSFGPPENMPVSSSINNIGSLTTNTQENDCFGPNVRNMPVNFGMNNLGPARLQEPADGSNRFDPGPSPDFDPVIEKWRAFQIRSRNQPYVLDDSYRQTHKIPEGEQYHQLFDPIMNPIVNSIRVLEKKNMFPRSKKLAAYKGIGFDLQMMAGRSDGEDDDVKAAARDCKRKILTLYPSENKKRRSRRHSKARPI